MPQRTFFSREAILEAAFQLTRERGWAGVTSRSIAKRLGSSTMPIYSTTRSMSEIEREVRRRAEAVLLAYQRRPASADIALSKALGYVSFARDEKNLFRFLYVDRPAGAGRIEGEASGEEAGDKAPPATTFEELVAGDALPTLEEQTRVAMGDPRILKSWIFTHGLASMLASGVIELSDEAIRSLLLAAGTALIQSTE